MSEDVDFAYALSLQEQFNREYDSQKSKQNPIVPSISSNSVPLSVVDESWEVIDPIPDIRQLFLQFNDTYFSGLLGSVEVRWSPRMTLCAGLCCYEGRGGLCSIRLSEPLLKLRPRKDLVQTLLHEMIHALLFVTHNNKDHDAHGPEFLKHMQRINAESGANITVYHSFHDEVDVYRQHWWQCDGPCRKRPPYYGMVRRAMNRAPSPRDPWWADHQRTCGGTYTKIKEPENYGAKKSSKSKQLKGKDENEKEFKGKGHVLSGKNEGTLPHFFKRKSRENDKDCKGSSGSGNETVKRRKKDVGNSIVKTESVGSGMGKQNPASRPGSSTWTEDVIPFSGPGRALGSGPVVDSSEVDSSVASETFNSLATTDKTQKDIRSRTKTSEVIMIKRPSAIKHQTSHSPTLTIMDAFKRTKDSAVKESSGDITSSLTLGSKGELIEVLGDSPLSNVLWGSKRNLESLQSNSAGSSERNSQLHVTHLVSCPVCQTLVRTFEINQHLDTCL